MDLGEGVVWMVVVLEVDQGVNHMEVARAGTRVIAEEAVKQCGRRSQW
jgi:hypothetical protein